jgi:hypothetical protein
VTSTTDLVRLPSEPARQAELLRHYRRLTAVHEAGHAIVYFATCLKIQYATIKPNGISSGHVRIITVDDNDRPTAHAEIAQCLAGHVAEVIDDGVAGPTYDRYGNLSDRLSVEEDGEDFENADLHSAFRVARRCYASEGKAWRAIEEAWKRVDRWLRQPAHWAAVTELAEWLETIETVYGGDIYSIASSHGVRSRDRALLPVRRHFVVAEEMRAGR